MTDVNLDFIYQGNAIRIQGKRNEYMKDIVKRYIIKIDKDMSDAFFICNGNKISTELKLEEINNKGKEIKILIGDANDKNSKNKEEKSNQNKDVICPECGNICLLDINDYKIKLNQCINNHNTENILLDEYYALQKNNELNVVCSKCNKSKNEIYKKQLYKCCTCKINICPICKSKHNENHILIDYDSKNYIYNVHGEKYISYCKECNANLCDICEIEHNKNHNYSSLSRLITHKKNNINELRIKIDDLKKEINDIISKFNKIVNNLEIYYKINDTIIKN